MINIMWVEVKYKTVLEEGTPIRVIGTKHEAVISKVIGKPQLLHCLCYHIEPKDPNNPGGHWYFSHLFEIKQ